MEAEGEQIVTLLQHVTSHSTPASLILNGTGADLKPELPDREELVIHHGQAWPLDFMQRLQVRTE